MSAVPANPSSDTIAKADTFLLPFRDKLQLALDLAREAAVTTSTHAWLANYEAQQKAHWRAIAEACSEITRTVGMIRNEGSCEDWEKVIKDSVKQLSEEREQFEAWVARQVSAYRRAAEDVGRVIESAQRALDEAERQNPLIYRGIADEIRSTIAGWPRASWDAKAGTVTVTG